MSSYRLNTESKEKNGRKYTKEELSEMTTYQLRNICVQEKIVKILTNTLDRENLINTILRFRSAEEEFLINSYKEDGFENVAKMLKEHFMTRITNNGKIKIPARIVLYPEVGITIEDMYMVEANNNVMEQTNVLLVNDNNELCGIFNLIKDEIKEDSFYLVGDKNIKIEKSNNRNYSLLFFRKDDSEYIYKTYYSQEILFPASLQYYKEPIVQLEIRGIEETNTVLAIDFGTSNTTAGAYLSSNYIIHPCYNDILNKKIELNQINFVKFIDVNHKEELITELLPTVVYVENCADIENIKYSFGYEAQKIMKKNDYTCNASIFQGIKRWVNNYSNIEEIYDENGNIANVERGQIIRAYLKHVIGSAEHQFKCRFKKLHISTPVKLKAQFIDMFNEILPEYEIEGEKSLDEGIAVLFNTIANQIEKRNFEENEEYKALVIDCGGGTTDLSSCSFRIEEGNISYKIDIKTMYENGDTNFGGNNITYRIMQFMKIIFASYYLNRKIDVDIDTLIDIPNGDIFRYVDEMGAKELYAKFESSYNEAESVIPTRFKEYENNVRDKYQAIKNNFYFLWEIAENMKKEFFRKTSILRNRFDSSSTQEESDLIVTPLRKWNLSMVIDGELRSIYEFPNVVFNIKEINKLIKGDIYDIVRKFLEKYYLNRTLQDYNIIKLTGQSCRIDIFKEALKEFVPGRSIEFSQKKEEDERVLELKLSCLRGVIRYINSRKIGDIEVNITNDVPIIPYSVSSFTYNKQEKMLIFSLEKMNQEKGYISRPIGAVEIEFCLNDAQGNLKQKYIYDNNFSEYKSIIEDDLEELYGGDILQEDTDTIDNGEIRFFVFAHEKRWGFHVVPIGRNNDQLYAGKKKYYAFENDLSELDFFDGLK